MYFQSLVSSRYVTLSSGSPYTLHADFWNAWDQARLVHLVDYCVNGGRKCS